MTNERERMTDAAVGALIDLSYVQVNRIRNDARQPSVEAMVRIEKALDWPVADQVRARVAGDYASKFEDAITRYASGRKTAAGPEESASPAPHDHH